MHPEICKIGFFTIHSYGLMLAIAVIVCSFALSRDAQRFNIAKEFIFDLVFWLMTGGILGARLFYIASNFSFFAQNPVEMVMIQRGGLSWQGGLVLGCLTGIWFTRKNKISLPLVLDLSAPYLALGQAIGRIGCFLNGCCYGKESAWGIYFPVHQARLYPTQLFCSFGLLIVFFVLKHFQKNSKIRGQIFVLYLLFASSLRFVIEFFRADHVNLMFGLSLYQYICLGLIGVAMMINARLRK